VTLSSTEAEFVAAVEGGKEIKWTRNILSEFGYHQTLPSMLFVDNKSGICVAKNPEHHGRMKQLDLCFFFFFFFWINGIYFNMDLWGDLNRSPAFTYTWPISHTLKY
jgi:hypothetical protein